MTLSAIGSTLFYGGLVSGMLKEKKLSLAGASIGSEVKPNSKKFPLSSSLTSSTFSG
jgi:hypothetical protein